MDAKNLLTLLILILLSPLLLYLREQAYRSTHGKATIDRDLSELLQSFRRWREERRLRQKYKNLNKKQRYETSEPDTKSK